MNIIAGNSFASELTSTVCQFRNPQGAQRNWLEREREFVQMPSCKLLFLAECGFLLATALGIAEVALNLILTITAFLYKRVNEDFYFNQKEKLISSLYSTVWAGANLIFNFMFPNLLTEPDTAIEWARRYTRV